MMERPGSGPVLLGELDRVLEVETDMIDVGQGIVITSSKIGGLPSWIDRRLPSGKLLQSVEETISLSGLVCKQCGSFENLTLVLQAYAPLEISETYDDDDANDDDDAEKNPTNPNESIRVLYVFVCLSSLQCMNGQRGWLVIRGTRKPRESIIEKISRPSTNSIDMKSTKECSSTAPITIMGSNEIAIKSSNRSENDDYHHFPQEEDASDLQTLETLLTRYESLTLTNNRPEKSRVQHNQPRSSRKSTIISSDSISKPLSRTTNSIGNPASHFSQSIFIPITLYVDEEATLTQSILHGSDENDEDELTLHAYHLLDEYEKRGNDYPSYHHQHSRHKSSHSRMNHQEDPMFMEESYSRTPFTKEFKTFRRFQTLIQRYPRQIIRYCLDGDPLEFIGSSIRLSNDTCRSSSSSSKKDSSIPVRSIPMCTRCGANRRFELQILSTLIPHLKLVPGRHHETGKSTSLNGKPLLDPSIDFNWGTIYVYTCERDCYTAVCSEVSLPVRNSLDSDPSSSDLGSIHQPDLTEPNGPLNSCLYDYYEEHIHLELDPDQMKCLRSFTDSF